MTRTRKMLEAEIRKARGQLTRAQSRARGLEAHLEELDRLLASLPAPVVSTPETANNNIPRGECDEFGFRTCPLGPCDLTPGSVTERVYRYLCENNTCGWSGREITEATGLDRESVGWSLTGLYHARLVSRRPANGCFQYKTVV